MKLKPIHKVFLAGLVLWLAVVACISESTSTNNVAVESGDGDAVVSTGEFSVVQYPEQPTTWPTDLSFNKVTTISDGTFTITDSGYWVNDLDAGYKSGDLYNQFLEAENASKVYYFKCLNYDNWHGCVSVGMAVVAK